jgi:hypothetical protein
VNLGPDEGRLWSPALRGLSLRGVERCLACRAVVGQLYRRRAVEAERAAHRLSFAAVIVNCTSERLNSTSELATDGVPSEVEGPAAAR